LLEFKGRDDMFFEAKNMNCHYLKIVDRITGKFLGLSGNTISYNVSGLSSGEYTFSMTCGSEKAMRKVVVLK
jgi:hypothetical protein